MHAFQIRYKKCSYYLIFQSKYFKITKITFFSFLHSITKSRKLSFDVITCWEVNIQHHYPLPDIILNKAILRSLFLALLINNVLKLSWYSVVQNKQILKRQRAKPNLIKTAGKKYNFSCNFRIFEVCLTSVLMTQDDVNTLPNPLEQPQPHRGCRFEPWRNY